MHMTIFITTFLAYNSTISICLDETSSEFNHLPIVKLFGQKFGSWISCISSNQQLCLVMCHNNWWLVSIHLIDNYAKLSMQKLLTIFISHELFNSNLQYSTFWIMSNHHVFLHQDSTYSHVIGICKQDQPAFQGIHDPWDFGLRHSFLQSLKARMIITNSSKILKIFI